MRRHTVVGEEILSSVSALTDVGRLVRHSHERWDGKGYPDGLMGPEIPLGSRIIFCADAFHAIRCDRPYRAGRSANEALAEIKRFAGSQFDPTVATALEEVVRERQSRPRGAASSRLFALLMCLVVGAAGTAIARSGLLSEASAPPPSQSPKPPPACGTAACPTVGVPVGGLAPVGVPGLWPGSRALQPGLPGRLHGGIAGGKESGADGKADDARDGSAKEEHGSNPNGTPPGHSQSHAGGQSSSQGSATPGSSSSSGGGGSSHSNSGHHSSGGSHSSSGHHSGGSGGNSGGSHGNSGGSRGAASNGNSGSSGNAGGSSGSHGK
jgi:hypothetical protein